MNSAKQIVRATAGRVMRSDELDDGEKEIAAAILRANPLFGNPHVVRCDWCHQTRVLFRDENDPPFTLNGHGWFCEPCAVFASSQEIRM
jgi:hypothetical protein